MDSILNESDAHEMASLTSMVAKRGTVAMSVIVFLMGFICLVAGALVHSTLDTKLEVLPFLSYQSSTLPVLVLVWGLFSALIAPGIGFLVVKKKELLKSDKRFLWGCFGTIAALILVTAIALGLFISNSNNQVANIEDPCASAWPHLLAAAQQEIISTFSCCGWAEPCVPSDVRCQLVIPEYIMDELANAEGCLIVLMVSLIIYAIFFELFRRYTLFSEASSVRSYDELEGLAQQGSEDENEI